MVHLPKIIFRVVAHRINRNNECDDYYPTKDGWCFTVSKMNAKYEFLVFIHALVEWFLCMCAGIKEKDITAFDKKFEVERADGKWTTEEAGNDPRSPYGTQHKIATSVEMLLAAPLGVDWERYEKAIDKLK